MSDKEYGKCFYCGDKCNILSQGCSSCLRKITKRPVIVFPKVFYESKKIKKNNN